MDAAAAASSPLAAAGMTLADRFNKALEAYDAVSVRQPLPSSTLPAPVQDPLASSPLPAAPAASIAPPPPPPDGGTATLRRSIAAALAVAALAVAWFFRKHWLPKSLVQGAPQPPRKEYERSARRVRFAFQDTRREAPEKEAKRRPPPPPRFEEEPLDDEEEDEDESDVNFVPC